MTEDDIAVLKFERRFYAQPGSKEQAITTELGLTPTRYYQLLNTLIDQPAAMATDPVLINRLRRLRSARQRARHARALHAI